MLHYNQVIGLCLYRVNWKFHRKPDDASNQSEKGSVLEMAEETSLSAKRKKKQ